MILVIGNGESRRDINIDGLDVQKIGCNAVHRDFHVDHLVCIDKKPLIEALSSDLKSTTIWTRPEYLTGKCCPVPETPPGNQRADLAKHWGSGPYAVLIACQLSNEIHMIGFDLYSKNNQVNNVYKGTDCYAVADSHAVDPRYWIYQIQRVFLDHRDKYFIVYNESNWNLPESWFLDNVEFKTLDSFKSRL